MKKSLIIIGGGIGGLYAADKLAEYFYKVTIIEKDKELGGLARSIKYKDNYIEKFYHYYGPETPNMFDLLDELDLSSRVVWSKVSRASFINGKFFPLEKKVDILKFSLLSFMDRLRLGVLILKTRYITKWQFIDHLLASDWLINEIGEKAYNILWKPLLKLKFKEFEPQIPAPFIWSRIKIQQEKIAYIRNGLNEVLQLLEERLKKKSVKMMKNCSVENIIHENGKVVGVRIDKNNIVKADTILTTIPSPVLSRICEFQNPEKDLIEEKEWMGVVCAVLILDKQITDYMWLNVDDERIPFVGVIDYTHLNPEYLIDGCRVVYVPDYVSTSHEHYKMSDDEFLNKVISSLKIINTGFTQSSIRDAFVFRAPFAQNIPFRKFGDKTVPVKSKIKGLFIADWSQFYPWDRGLSNSIKIAKKAASIILKANKE